MLGLAPAPGERHVSPAERCTCAACDGARLVVMTRLSAPQRRALAALDPKVPRHPRDLRQRDGVRWQTLSRLSMRDKGRPALVRMLDLKGPLRDSPYFTFLILAQEGVDMLAAERRAKRKGS